jgi:hypothetical protein
MQGLPTLSNTDLKPWFNKEELIRDCVAQIQKDLSAYAIDITFSGNIQSAYQELFEQLQPKIDRMLQTNTSISDILYKVDVDEKKLKEVALSEEAFSHSLTRLIIWRELQKVVTRFLLRD